MRYNHFDMLPERAFQRVGGRMTLEGGSGGGGSQAYYGNMDQLYGVQAQAAQYMLDNSMPYIPEYLSNSNQMVNEAMNGSLDKRLRGIAEQDALTSAAQATEANNQNLARYGVNPNSGAFVDAGLKTSVMNAANTTAAKNRVGEFVEGQKWNRNAGALGQVTGMGMGSMESLGGTARGYGAAGSSLMGNESLNAAGYGKFGAAVASNAFKDGGKVDKTNKPGLHLAAGGTSSNPWASWKNNNPIQTTNQNDNGGGTGDALGAVALGAAPIVLGKGMKAGLSAVKGAMTPASPAAAAPTASTGSGLTTGTASVETGGAMANGTEGLAAAKGAADSSAAVAGADAATATTAATTGAETAALTGTLEGAAATGAAIDAGAGGGAALGALAADGAAAGGAAAAGELTAAAGASATMGPVGWVAAGALALGALGVSQGWFADGGNVRRKDFTPGGDVSGPGTATSDAIPAWLSDGEHVNNATAVQLAGLDTLETINNAGLSVREGKQSTASAKAKIGKAMIDRGEELVAGLHLAKGGKVGCKMSGGGFLNGNTGIALGAAADEWNKQRVLGMEQALTDLRVKLARPQIELQDDQIAAGRSLYKYQDAANQAGVETLPQQTANAKKQQQLTGIGLDTALTGNAGKKMSYGNKDDAIKILNQAAAAQPGFDGTTVVDVTPQKNGAGVFLHMSDQSKKAVSRDEIVGAMGAIKQGEFQAVKDDAGNIFAFDKATGNVDQKVKGDPNNLPGRAKPADVASAEWLINNGVAKDAKSAWDLVRSSREKTRSDFVLDYVSKNAMPGSDITQASKQAGDLYDSLRNNQPQAATQGTPTAGTGKSGTNWKDWMKSPQ